MDIASSRTQEARRAPIARTLLTTLLLAALLWAVPPARGARAAGFAAPASRAVGAPGTAAIDRAGTVGAAPDGGVTCAAVVAQAANPHCVASVFWDSLNSRGPVYAGGGDGDAPLFEPLFYVTGLPLTEAYWAQ